VLASEGSNVESHPVPKVGDTVVLNDHGLEAIFGKGLVRTLNHMKSVQMKITYVDTMSMTEPEELFVVHVDHPEIDQYLIDNWCFDVRCDGLCTSSRIT